MRVWDVHPGYLSRKRLLGQHAEIHGVWSVLTKAHQGYSHHPETKRWRDQLPWLAQVHNLTAAEMKLRGFNHLSPVGQPGEPLDHLDYVDSPLRQFALLREKQRNDEGARLAMPRFFQDFWMHHEYAVMARGQEQYKSIEAKISIHETALGDAVDDMEIILDILRRQPIITALGNVLQDLAQKAGISPDSTQPGTLAKLMYDVACKKGDILLQSHTVFTDALALDFGGGEM